MISKKELDEAIAINSLKSRLISYENQVRELKRTIVMQLAELAELRKQTWQPIESAPRDGTRIVGAHFKLGYVAVLKSFRTYEWEQVDINGNGMGIGFFPTHWKPLDPPHAPESEV